MTGPLRMSGFYAMKDLADEKHRQYKAAGEALKALPGAGSGPMGLTPDHVRATDTYKRLKRERDAAFEALRNINAQINTVYKREYAEFRKIRMAQKKSAT